MSPFTPWMISGQCANTEGFFQEEIGITSFFSQKTVSLKSVIYF